MRKALAIAVLLAAGALVVLAALRFAAERERRREVLDVLAQGRELEAGGEPARAASVYAQGEDLELEPAERTELRLYRARALIAANDLAGALGILHDLGSVDEDGGAAPHGADLGPLYKELGNRALARGQRDLAKVAFMSGRKAAPERTHEFNRELEKLILPPPPAAGERPPAGNGD